jgi:hypothetical protein
MHEWQLRFNGCKQMFTDCICLIRAHPSDPLNPRCYFLFKWIRKFCIIQTRYICKCLKEMQAVLPCPAGPLNEQEYWLTTLPVN